MSILRNINQRIDAIDLELAQCQHALPVSTLIERLMLRAQLQARLRQLGSQRQPTGLRWFHLTGL